MRASDSHRNSDSAFSIQHSALRSLSPWSVPAIAAAYLLAHLPVLAPSLEDIDSINFALGLRDFNPALHQPHPPGYPIYIALGRLSLAAVSRVTALAPVQAEALALALWSALAGAVAIVAAARLFRAVESQTSSRSTIHPPSSM